MEQKFPQTLSKFPLEEAKRCIIAYKTAVRNKSIPEQNIIKAYLLQTTDIFQALNIHTTGGDSCSIVMDHPQVRVYIGMYAGTGSEANIYKLFLVPVDVTGKDIIPTGIVDPTDPREIQYVYDFNTPCPRTCDETSPLYLAGEK